jgi:hypothetical protein
MGLISGDQISGAARDRELGVNRHRKLSHRFASLSVTSNWCRDRIGHFLCLRLLSG